MREDIDRQKEKQSEKNQERLKYLQKITKKIKTERLPKIHKLTITGKIIVSEKDTWGSSIPRGTVPKK